MSFFVFMGNLVAHDVVARLNYFYFIYTLFFLYKSNRYTCLCNVRKCSSFRRRVRPLWPGFLGMVFHMLLVFHINFINNKCCIQHTYAIFLLTFLTLWEYQCAMDRLWKKSEYIFLWMIDINDMFNVCSTIRYYNARHIKDNIHVKQKQNETILGWWLWKQCIQTMTNFVPMILRELWRSSMC